MSVAVIISTYNQPQWLEKVLYAYRFQDYGNFEVIVADDGSDARTVELLDQLQPTLPFPLQHVWHEDEGFRKTVILNEAIRRTEAEYLIFTDGDCVPRRDFVAKHIALREPGRFLSGGYVKLPRAVSQDITLEDIATGRCFDAAWLKQQDPHIKLKSGKLTARGRSERLLNIITPTKASWNGMNSSGWRRDILAVNGFDERMQYGGEDRELGERLENKGIRGKQIRYSAVCLHLWHERGYVRPEMLENNKAIRKATRTAGSVWTAYGLEQS